MTVELRPLGVLCNLQCQYCYQEPIRQADNIRRHYDIDKMKEAILEDGGPFVLFGGEPLLVPIEDLEKLFAWGLETFGKNGVQSNGALITADHIRLFREYKVGVGISIDGPGELNDLRRNGNLQRTREATARTQASISALCAEGLPPGLIVTLHKGNTGSRLLELIAWLADLESIGISSVRLHLLESESREIRDRFALSDEETSLHCERFMHSNVNASGCGSTSSARCGSCCWGWMKNRHASGMLAIPRQRRPFAVSKGRAKGQTAAGRTRKASISSEPAPLALNDTSRFFRPRRNSVVAPAAGFSWFAKGTVRVQRSTTRCATGQNIVPSGWHCWKSLKAISSQVAIFQ